MVAILGKGRFFMTETTKRRIAGAGLITFVLLTSLISWLVGKPLVQFASEPERFRDWIDSFGLWGPLIFALITALQVFVAFIPGEPLEIAAGYAFGAVEGTLLCLAGMCLGSAAVFLFVRKFGIKAVEIFVPKEKILSSKLLRNKKKVRAFFLIAYLLPGTPKDVLTYCAGLSSVGLPQWLLVSSVCRLPSVVTSTIGGDALGSEQYFLAISVFAVAVALGLIGLAIYKKLNKE